MSLAPATKRAKSSTSPALKSVCSASAGMISSQCQLTRSSGGARSTKAIIATRLRPSEITCCTTSDSGRTARGNASVWTSFRLPAMALAPAVTLREV